MNHRNRVLRAAALCVAALAVRGSAAPATSTLSPAVANPAGLEFTLKLPPGKTSFMQGETIPLSLSFVNSGPQTLGLNEFYRSPPTPLPFASFEVEPKEGTSNPLGDLPVPTFISIAGAIPLPVRLAAIPTQEPFSLNEYVRFDRPGTYTIRAVTSRVFIRPEATTPPRASLFPSGKPFISTSEPISIQIVPADPKWQMEQVQAWRAFWAKQKADFVRFDGKTALDTVRPANDLRFLNTRAAAQAMIDHLGQDAFLRNPGAEDYSWRSGFIGFSERAWLVSAMKDARARPDYPVTQGFMDILATLETLQNVAPGAKARLTGFGIDTGVANRANWQQINEELKMKTGRARAVTLFSLLETAWNSPMGQAPEIAARLPRLIAQVPDVFDDLPPSAQEYFIDDQPWSKQWARVKSPRFAAPLRRLWDATHVEPNGLYRYFPNAILHRLVEVSPSQGRALILKEMAAPHPRVSFEVLSLLPDKRLPQLQNLWLSHLNQDGEDQDVAALLIGRYATDAIKAHVKAQYVQLQRNKMLSSSMNQGLSRYLARVK